LTMSGTWIPNVGYVTFGRQHVPDVPEFVPVHDPNEPPNSPYFVPAPPAVEVVAVEPVVELTPGQKAEALLRDVLALDPVPATTVEAIAKERSIASRTLRRARKRMKVSVFKKSGCWWWASPEWEEIKVAG